MSKIEKSPLVIAQEKEIASLEANIKKTNTVIKALKTRKKNTEKEFVDRQSEMFNRGSRTMEEARKLNEEISNLLKKLIADKRFTEEDRMIFSDMLAEYEVSAQLFEEQSIPEVDPEEVEEARAKARHFYKEFEVKTSKEEKKNIRQLYLQLSREFHPDKIINTKQKAQAKALQQKIIQAYEANDYQALLDIQAMHSEKVLEDMVEGDTDVLAARIKVLQQKLEQLLAQKERLSQELKAFRESDQGRMLSATKSAEREGYSFGEISGLDEMEEMLDEVKAIRDALAKSLELGQVCPELAKLLEPVEEDFPFFGDLVDDFLEEAHNPNPLFPEGTLVKVTENFTEIEEWDTLFPIYGTVEEALSDPYEEYQPAYNIRIHSKSLKTLPKVFFQDQHDFDDPIDQLKEVPEEYIQLAAGVQPETPSQQVENFKRVWIDALLYGKIEDAYLNTIQEAIFSYKDDSVAVCWKKYLKRHITLPQQVLTVSNVPNMWKKGETLRWTQIEEIDHPDFPVMIRVEKSGGLYARVPLSFFQAEDKKMDYFVECTRALESLIEPVY
jgi:hypothetical protein